MPNKTQEDYDREYLASILPKYRRNGRGSYIYIGEISIHVVNGKFRLGYMFPDMDEKSLISQVEILERYYDNPGISIKDLFNRWGRSSVK